MLKNKLLSKLCVDMAGLENSLMIVVLSFYRSLPDPEVNSSIEGKVGFMLFVLIL